MKATLAKIALSVVIMILSTTAFAADEQVLKDEAGLLRMQVSNPESNSTIEKTQPAIGADASGLEVPLDANTVTITVDGVDVTEYAEITSGYIIYRPPSPLLPGKHEVRITASDINKRNIEPLSWVFFIKGEAKAVVSEEKDKTNGRLIVSTDFVKADYTPQSVIDVSSIFAEKNGTKLNADLTFANVSAGRTILGSFHRETQQYTDIEIDKFRTDYFDENFKASVGHFWMALSDLSVLGTELAGARMDKDIDQWRFSLFSGRTQDPSTSGTFKQTATGLKTSYNWNNRHTSSITALTAAETESTGSTSTVPLPTKDNMVSFLHEYSFMENMKATLEYSLDNRRERSSTSTHDDAVQFTLTGSYKTVSGEIAAYDLGENFYPIAEGNSKYLKNDREGFRGKGAWQALNFMSVGGEYEQYDRNSDDVTTKRGSAFVAVSYGFIQTLKYQKTKLTSEGTVSETDSVNGVIIVPAAGNFTETRLSLGWRDTSYTSTLAQTESETFLFGLNTSYRDRLGFAASYSETQTDNILSLTAIENTSFSIGLNWNIIPFKLLWTGRYEEVKNSGDLTDNEEARFKTAFKYVVDNRYTLNLGWDTVDYSDTISTVYNYTQNIVRSGVEWSF